MSADREHRGRYTAPKAKASRCPPERARDGWRLLDPDPVEARRRLDALGPLGDQLEAALGDQLGLLRGIYQSDVRTATAWAPWAKAAIGSWVAAGRPRCPHVDGAAPQPLWILAWDPVLRCTTCMAVAQLVVRGTAEDATCDGCRRHAPDDDGLVWPTAATGGNLSILAGLCDACCRCEQKRGAA